MLKTLNHFFIFSKEKINIFRKLSNFYRNLLWSIIKMQIDLAVIPRGSIDDSVAMLHIKKQSVLNFSTKNRIQTKM